MTTKNKSGMLVLPIIISGVLTGCQPIDIKQDTRNPPASEKQKEIDSLRANLSTLQTKLQQTEQQNTQLKQSQSYKQQALNPTFNDPNTPPNAKAGECFAWVFTPPQFKTEVNTLLKQEKAEKIDIIPAKYEWVDKRVMVKEASERLETVEAKYDWVTERVLVRPASTKLIKLPAEYKEVEERVMVSPARTYWKKGSGLITKVNGETGEIMCLIEEPAQYKMVKKHVLARAESTREVEDQPAEYETVRRQVMASPPTTRKVVIPAEYKMVKIKQKVEDARTRKIAIPETYQQVTKQVKIAEGQHHWQRILCETNMSMDIVRAMQSALNREGFYRGPIDGIIGNETADAITQYQRKKGLSTGGVTYEVLESLSVKI